jgi:cytochrome c
MTFMGIKKPEDRAAVIAWLRTLADGPAALPTDADIAAEAPAPAAPVAETVPADATAPAATTEEPKTEGAETPAEEKEDKKH